MGSTDPSHPISRSPVSWSGRPCRRRISDGWSPLSTGALAPLAFVRSFWYLMDLLARIEVDGVCLGGIRLSGVLRPKQVASVGAQTKTRAWAFRLGSSCPSGVSHARCKWLPATCSPYHTSIRARLATPVRSLLPVTSNILPTNTPLRGCTNMGNHGAIIVM